jgi:hypothetical protein
MPTAFILTRGEWEYILTGVPAAAAESLQAKGLLQAGALLPVLRLFAAEALAGAREELGGGAWVIRGARLLLLIEPYSLTADGLRVLPLPDEAALQAALAERAERTAAVAEKEET